MAFYTGLLCILALSIPICSGFLHGTRLPFMLGIKQCTEVCRQYPKCIGIVYSAGELKCKLEYTNVNSDLHRAEQVFVKTTPRSQGYSLCLNDTIGMIITTAKNKHVCIPANDYGTVVLVNCNKTKECHLFGGKSASLETDPTSASEKVWLKWHSKSQSVEIGSGNELGKNRYLKYKGTERDETLTRLKDIIVVSHTSDQFSLRLYQ